MKKIEIRLTGIGGQGVVLLSVILGRAASIYDKINAVQTQTYGSDMRGGDVCTEVIIAKERIIYPVINNPDILVVLTQRAYDKNIKDIKSDGILIIDKDLVKIYNLKEKIKCCSINFNKLAIDKLTRKTAMNMIVIGYLLEITKIVSFDSIKKAIADLVPEKTVLSNIEALNLGRCLAKK
jgi:2-oxoglutarate ferredoxin oxidoreductase subunit gamma